MAALMSIQRRLILRLPYKCLRNLRTHEASKVETKFFFKKVQTYSSSCLHCKPRTSQPALEFSRCISISSKLYAESAVVCPAFAESVTEGDIRWVKSVGDSVAVDDVVAEIETDKTTVEVISPHSGVVTKLLVEDGTAVRPKMELCMIDSSADASAAAPPTPSTTAPPPEPPPSTPEPEPPTPPKPDTPPPKVDSTIPETLPPVPPVPTAPMSSTPVSDVKVTPLTELPQIPLHGARTEQRVKISRMRQRIAARLKEAQNTCAMLTTFNEVDMSNIMALREQYKDKFSKEHGVKLGFMSAFLKAAAYALKSEPAVNAVIEGTEIVYRDYVDISVAVATPKGLVVPVLRNVEIMSYAQIEKSLNDLGEKARLGNLAIEDMDGGTFTISNGGVFGSMFGTPIINPPQSAILGMHGIFDRPVAIKGQVLIRPMMYIALTYDHRLIDGREAVLFLRRVKNAVEDPSVMFLDL